MAGRYVAAVVIVSNFVFKRVMPGIANISIKEFRRRVSRFSRKDVNDWNQWLSLTPNETVARLGPVLRKWGACRPNRMRRSRFDRQHKAPYLEDLVAEAAPHLRALRNFDIRVQRSFTREAVSSLRRLWTIFEQLSYDGPARDGLAGVVGISKAMLLLTNGRVGPAFDSVVRKQLGVGKLLTADDWIRALEFATMDVQAFERANRTTLQKAAPRQYARLGNGRLYDMALWAG